jgi:hypothetical protein
MDGGVTTAEPDRRIAWRLETPLRLSARLSLDLEDDSSGVIITHTTQVGFVGWGKVLDPVLRLYFSDEFARDLECACAKRVLAIGRTAFHLRNVARSCGLVVRPVSFDTYRRGPG